MCGDLIRLQTVNGLGESSCFYDSTSHELVGAQKRGHSADYCSNTSATQNAGRVTSCDSPTGTVTFNCDIGVTDPAPPGCAVPLMEVSGQCPATFDGTAAQFPSCGLTSEVISSRPCAGLTELKLQYFGVISTAFCYYDPDTHALVGVLHKSDAGCSEGRRAGTLPKSCATTATATLDCSIDAGAAN
jgi:hypothetical protein